LTIRDLNGRTHSWQLGKYVGKQRMETSQLHADTRDFLTEKYPAMQILEEVYLPGESMFLDFYMPAMKLAIECQGVQHDKFVPHFHGSKMKFFAGKANDRRKLEWCQLNGIKLIYFYPKEDVETWQQKLSQ